MDDEKIYGEKEAGEVIRRAVELQEADQHTAYTPGVTSQQLVDLAKEIGVDARYLEQAIREHAKDGRKGPLNLTEEFERVVEGELSPDRFDIVLERLKPFGRRHQPTQIGRTLTARVWTGISEANVQVVSRNGRTRINVKSNPMMAYLMGLHPAIIGSVIALPALAGHGHLGIGMGVFGGLLTAGGLAFRWLLGKGHEASRRLANQIEGAVTDETKQLAGNLQNAPATAESQSMKVDQRT